MQTPFSAYFKNSLFALLGFSLLLGCEPKGESPELIALKARVSNDSLELVNLQAAIDTINATLDSAQMLKMVLKDANNINRLSASEKINAIDSLLTITIKQADQIQLNSESNNPIKKMLNEALREKSLLLAEQKAYYAKVQAEIESLSSAVINMTRIIEAKDRELIAKDNIINKLATARKEKEQELNDALVRLRNTEVMIEKANRSMVSAQKDAKKRRAQIFFEAGNTLKEEFERLDNKKINIGTKKARESLVKQAVEYYEQAAKLGHIQAGFRLEEMKSKNQYARFLKD